MSQITLEQRYEIASLIKTGVGKQEIAHIIGCHKTTIYRELKRNIDLRSNRYNASLADRKCRSRHINKPKKLYMTSAVISNIEKFIREDYSPEQVVGICIKRKMDCVSHETIYNYIWQLKKSKSSNLHQHLRRQGRRYKKRSSVNSGRGMIKHRIGIERRPEVVEDKKRFGDLEVDTIIGKDHIGAIVTINDRASGMLKMKRTETRGAFEVSAAINELLEDWTPYIKTITADNGKEFAEHQRVSENSQVDFYFADPYSSWQRGANENLNGLIRQYFPKKTDFSNITNQQIIDVQNKLNNRPRKRFNFDTPIEVMDKLLFKPEVAFIG